MTRATLDLGQLALDRAPAEAASQTRRPRRWVTRYVLPAAILLGFLSLLATAAGTRLLPQRSVEVIPVIVKRAEVQQAGTTLFQAAGWIEPRPTAISVAALAPGVIEELLVVEGQQVAKGEPIARLVTLDAEIDVQQAEATLAICEGELRRALAERKAAEVRREQPVHLQVELAEAMSVLAKAQTELAKLPYLVESAEANVDFTRRSMQGKLAAESAIAGRVLEQAKSDHTSAYASLQELRHREPNLKRELNALQSKVDALQKQLDLLVEETRQLEEATAKVQAREAYCEEARLQLRQARLALQRCVVRAPIAGRILRLIASPGTRVMGLDATAGQDSSSVVQMYDPARLQVRVDVRLEDIPMVTRGQSVEIETASSPAVIQGRVLHATSTASIQKNTLEVKVELIDPPQAVTPEMLVTATFLAPPVATTESQPTDSQRVFLPQRLVQSTNAGSFVWIVDQSDRAQRQAIVIGQSIPGGLVEAKEGLNVTNKLITSGVDGLRPGSPVHVSGEDPSTGLEK